MKYTKSLEDSKNLVHEVFINLWDKFDSLDTDTNFRSYLFTAVRNRSLNFVRDHKKHVMMDESAAHHLAEENNMIEVSELENEIGLAIESLPEKCREIFQLNRHEGLKYAEIAEKLNISVKTVEAQMSKALTVLRERLKEFLIILIFMMIK